jgi:rare lipoprotein A
VAKPQGGFYTDDAPDGAPPVNLDALSDPIPRAESFISSANEPYTVLGKPYTPSKELMEYRRQGSVSWYGRKFQGQRTWSGEIYDMYAITAAHPTLPIPSYARVTNLENGRSVMVRINDRGPYMSGRVADLSYETASVLGFVNQGSAQIQIAYVGPAPLNGDDSRMLMASVDTTTPYEQQGDTRVPLKGGIVGAITGLFGYAEAPNVSAAVDAATAMATRAGALDGWKASVDDDARKVHLELGTFSDPLAALSISESFAMLGAVDENQVETGGKPATRLTLTHLKPGVARADILSLAQQLGLNDLVLD